jgi:NAD kinase
MSRHIIDWNGKQIEQKCSGLIVSTGSGSTGWWHSCGRSAWKPTENIAKFLATELYSGDLNDDADTLKPNDELKVYSLNDDGVVSIDSWDEYSFNRGSEAIIKLGHPLKVVVPNYEP